MINGSPALDTAMSAGVVAWVPPELMIDWGHDGYGNGDDTSRYVADSWVVSHGFDDGLPGEVTQASGLGVSTLSVDLAGSPVWGASAARYFGTAGSGPTVSGGPRDTVPVRFRVGAVTSTGQELVSAFTGQLAGLSGRDDGGAELAGVARARDVLAGSVTMPVVTSVQGAYRYGLDATWPISYALHAVGLYPSPPARTGCVIHVPFHGSTIPFTPTRIYDGGQAHSWLWRATPGNKSIVQTVPVFGRGPWVGSIGCQSRTTEMRRLYMTDINTAASTVKLLCQAGSTGRLELWIKGDLFDAPISSAGALDNTGASTTFGSNIFEFRYRCSPNAGSVVAAVDATRHVTITIDDMSGHTLTVTSTGTIPEDGAWYFIGAAWSVSGKKAWVHLDGTTTSGTNAALVTTALPVSYDVPSISHPSIMSCLPISDLQVGNTNPDSAPWLSGVAWDRGAVQYPSTVSLVALAEPDALAAGSLIGRYAQAEAAYTGTDATGTYGYMPRSSYATTAGMAPAFALTDRTNIVKINADADPVRVRNVVTVTYEEVSIDPAQSVIAELVATTAVGAGQVLSLVLPSLRTLISVPTGQVSLVDNTGADRPSAAYATVCVTEDGTGTYATTAQITVTVTGWSAGAVFVTVYNSLPYTVFLVNNKGWPALSINGSALTTTPASVTMRDAASVADRGERALSIQLDGVQNAAVAGRTAQWALDLLAVPRVWLSDLAVTADPRRAPGDLATVMDASVTGVSGQWRVTGVETRASGPAVVQQLVTEPLIGTIGVVVPAAAPEGGYPGGAIVGQTVVAAEELVITPPGTIGKVVPASAPEGGYPGGAIVNQTVVAAS